MEMDTGRADMGEDHEFNYKPMKIKIWEQLNSLIIFSYKHPKTFICLCISATLKSGDLEISRPLTVTWVV